MPEFLMNPDSALEKTNAKFISRFQKMEKLALERNLNLSEMSLKKWICFGKKRKNGN
jgi:XTP/dITP diphosphohydrolase